MSNTRSARGERLGRVHASARSGGRHTEAEQDRTRGDAIGHADSAIDHLRDEADEDVKKDVVPHAGPRDVGRARLAPYPPDVSDTTRPSSPPRHSMASVPRSFPAVSLAR